MSVQSIASVFSEDKPVELYAQIQGAQSKFYYKPIDEDLTPWLSLHYPANSSYNGRVFICRRKAGTMRTVSRRNIDEVPYFVSNMHVSRRCDYYIMANTVKGVERKKKDLFSLNNIIVDIDCHTDGMPYELMINELVARCRRDLFECGVVPEPNSVIRTGRGVQFWWAIEPAAKALTFLYQRALSWFLEQFEHLLEEYPSTLSEFSVDRSASRNVVGLFRLPMTYNTTVIRKVSYEILHTSRYNLNELVEDFVPADYWEAKTAKRRRNAQPASLTENAPVINLSEDDVTVFDGGTNAMARRILQLVELRALRNAPVKKEMRDLFCFVVYCALLSIYDQDEAWRRLLAFNQGFKQPLERKELVQSMSAAQKHRYRLSNEWIVENLRVTPQEQAAICMQSSEGKRSNYTRDLLRQKKKQARDAKILSLYESGMSQSKISEEMHLARNTVAKVLREAKQADFSGSFDDPVLELKEPTSEVSECNAERSAPQKVITLQIVQEPTCSNLVRKYSFVSYRQEEPADPGISESANLSHLSLIRPPT